MKPFSARSRHAQKAFTLIEFMVAGSIAGMIMSAIVVGSIAMMRLFTATDRFYTVTSDQMRAMDYIAADLRKAVSGSVTNNGHTLTMKIPDYIDYGGKRPSPRDPKVSAKGTVTYGEVEMPIVTYMVVGAPPDQRIQRVFAPPDGRPVTTMLTSASANYQITFSDPANASNTASFSFGAISRTRKITTLISSDARFRWTNLPTVQQSPTASMTTVLRNIR